MRCDINNRDRYYTGKHKDHHLWPLLRALTLCFNPPQCLQQVFCELRLYGVLRSSAIIHNQDVRKPPSQVRPFCLLRFGAYF
jgi:hypothetical protein